MADFNKVVKSVGERSVLIKDIEAAIIKVMAKYPEVGIRFKTSSITISPLYPTGWDLDVKLVAYASILDKKTETPEK